MLVVNFHGIGDFPESRPSEEGAYWLAKDQFLRVLDLLAESVEQIDSLLTFDDGNVSDYTIAYPEIKTRNLRAKTFVLSSRIGASDLDMDAAQIRTLDSDGFRVGLHGQDHIDWRRLSAEELRKQLEEGRFQLQKIINRSVDEVAVPFGSYSVDTLAVIREAGFRTVYTSDKYPTLLQHAVVPRYTVTRSTNLEDLRRLISRAPQFYFRALGEIRYLIKSKRIR